MANIVMNALGTHGDVVPFIIVGQALRRRGHTVTLFTHCRFEQLTHKAGLGFVAFDTPEEYQLYMHDLHLLLDPVNKPHAVVEFTDRHCGVERCVREYNLMLPYCADPETVIIGRHFSSLAALILAETQQLPFAWQLVAPHMVNSLRVSDHLSRRQLTDSVNEVREGLGVPLISSWLEWITSPRMHICTWPDWFGPLEPHWPAGTELVGFVMNDIVEFGALPEALLTFLDQGPPPVLISGSTGLLQHSEFYASSIAGCVQAGQRVILLIQQSALPPNLPPGLISFESLPIASVLPYIKAIIHHGGIGTLARSIALGVPQLILPAGADRPDNAVRLRNLGVAEFVPPSRWSADAIAQALQRLLDNPGIRERSQALGQRIDQAAALERACQLVEAMVGDPSYLLPANAGIQPVAQAPAASAANRARSQLIASLSPERRALLAQRLRKNEFAGAPVEGTRS